MPVQINGATSGSATLQATDAQTVTLTLPATTGTLAVSGGSPSFATLTVTGDASISGLTVGKGGGAVVSNSAVGYQALNSNTTGTNGLAVGYQALYSNTTYRYNHAVGYQAGYNSNGGEFNNFFGWNAGYGTAGSFTGGSNCGFGLQACSSLSSGTKNIGFGNYTLNSTTTGGYNTAIGDNALYSNTTASNNTAVGYTALYSNTTGATNTAIGYQSLYANTTGTLNVAMGDGALSSNTNGGSNTAFGSGCLAAHTTGTNNTAIGRVAGSAITTGTYNTILGSQDSTLTTGSYNAFIGRYANASASSVSYALMINTDNTARTDKGSSSGFIFTGGSMYQGNNSASWATTSDQRLKKNIVDNNTGLDVINKIQVRNFEYRLPEEVDAELKPTDAVETTGIQIGVIAQEFAQVLPECVKQESTGVYSVDPDALTWYLINAVKELKATVDAQAARIAVLEGTK